MEAFDKQYLLELAHKYKQGTLTEAEQAYYDRWYNSKADDTLELPGEYAEDLTEVRDRMEANINERLGIGYTGKKGRVIQLWRERLKTVIGANGSKKTMAPSEFSKAQRTVYLVTRYINGSIDFAELQELDQWRKVSKHNESQFQEMIDPEKQTRAIRRMQAYDSKAMLEKVKQKIQQRTQEKEARLLNWKRLLIAAISLSLIGSFCYQYFYHKSPLKIAAINPQLNYIPAGSNKAVITLANGQRINLDDRNNGTIAQQSGSAIQKRQGGIIAYEPSTTSNTSDTTTHYNIITIPRGGQYQLVLADGTKVWLNAASSLKYPTQFNGKQRIVELSGEGYFEVVHNRRQPFIVKTRNQDIRDIGTHFNINAYADESQSVTTLIEGAVEINALGKQAFLHPGEQSKIQGGKLEVSNADIRMATAWKDGATFFRKTEISKALRELSRWYNIDIEYKGTQPDFTISGEVSRQADLSAVLKMLKILDIHYELQGRKLTISN